MNLFCGVRFQILHFLTQIQVLSQRTLQHAAIHIPGSLNAVVDLTFHDPLIPNTSQCLWIVAYGDIYSLSELHEGTEHLVATREECCNVITNQIVPHTCLIL